MVPLVQAHFYKIACTIYSIKLTIVEPLTVVKTTLVSSCSWCTDFQIWHWLHDSANHPFLYHLRAWFMFLVLNVISRLSTGTSTSFSAYCSKSATIFTAKTMNWREGVLLAILFYEIINTCYSIEVVIKFSLFKTGIHSRFSTARLLPNLAIRG